MRLTCVLGERFATSSADVIDCILKFKTSDPALVRLAASVELSLCTGEFGYARRQLPCCDQPEPMAGNWAERGSAQAKARL